MRWLYKIWGGYDRFRPSEIESRMDGDGNLALGWDNYADLVEPDDEVWVWFFEGARFTPGVYVKGHATMVDPENERLVMRVEEHSSFLPLTSPADNSTLGGIVRPRGRQVFLLPEAFRNQQVCDVLKAKAPSCAARHCAGCSYWQKLPLIKGNQLRNPDQIAESNIAVYASAFWVVANRSFAWLAGRDRTQPGVRRTTELFTRFKSGEAALAYPLARAIYAVLMKRGISEIDAVVPIPLSPEKVGTTLDRTGLLAGELGRLLRVPIARPLSLSSPIGKRAFLRIGKSDAAFRNAYAAAVVVEVPMLAGLNRLLLIDDVTTHGSTLRTAAEALLRNGFGGGIVAASAGQMTVQEAVAARRAVLKD